MSDNMRPNGIIYFFNLLHIVSSNHIKNCTLISQFTIATPYWYWFKPTFTFKTDFWLTQLAS